MSFAFDVVIVGGANYDYLVRGPVLPTPGETVHGRTLHEGPGGKGANQAVAAARLGARVAFVGKIGRDDRGRAIRNRLLQEGVEITCLLDDPQSLTGVALISVSDAGKKQIMVAPGANGKLTVDDVRGCAKILTSARIVLAQFEVPLSTIQAAIELSRSAGSRILLDPSPPLPATLLPSIKPLFRSLDLVRPNASEAAALSGIAVRDRKSARQAAMILLSYGAQAAIVPAADLGSVLLSRAGDECFLPRVPVAAADETGAGDAFCGALAAELARGGSLKDAAVFANHAAAFKTRTIGAQNGLPTRHDLKDLAA